MRVAFYESDITPPLGGNMWGMYKEVLAHDVDDRLYAKAVVVENEGETVAILSVDTCVIPPDMHDPVTKRVYEYTGIKPSNICICSNHTHTGAPVFDDPTVNCKADAAYKDVFMRLSADAVILAYKRLDEADAKFGNTEVEGIAFNRTFITENGRYITHGRGRADIKKPLGEVDNCLSVVSFERKGKPIGAIVSFSCHQCCKGDSHAYSGDYASIIEKELKKLYGEDFVSLFVLGACGDINHVNPDKSREINTYEEIGQILAKNASEVINNSVPVTGGVGALKEKVRVLRREADNDYVKTNIINYASKGSYMRIRNLMMYTGSTHDNYSDLYVQAIKIADVCFICLPGEIFVNIGLELKKKSPFEKAVIIENCNSYCGYIPTKEAFSENSDLYEISLAYHSCHVPQACDIISEKALEMVDALTK